VTRFHRWFLYGTAAVAASSGAAYFWMKRFLQPVDEWAVINHPLEPWALKLHVLSAPLMLFAVGLITTNHIWRNLTSSLPTGRQSGLAATLTFVPLVFTGYLIQVVTSPTAADVLGWSHLVLGAVCAWALAVHRTVLRPKRLKRRRRGALPVVRIAPEAGAVETEAAGERPTRPPPTAPVSAHPSPTRPRSRTAAP
jgi:hypothetical protein